MRRDDPFGQASYRRRRALRFAADWAPFLAGALLLLGALAMLGCESGTKRIGQAASRIDAAAEATVGDAEGAAADLDAAVATGEVGPGAVPHVEAARAKQASIIARQEEVRSEVGAVRDALPGVQDRPSTLGRLLVLAGWLLGGGLLVVLLWQTGIGLIVRAFVARLAPWLAGLLIPRKEQSQAAVDAEAVASGAAGPEYDKAIAMRRAADPAYDAAYRAAKRRTRFASENPNPPPNSPPPAVQTRPAPGGGD